MAVLERVLRRNRWDDGQTTQNLSNTDIIDGTGGEPGPWTENE